VRKWVRWICWACADTGTLLDHVIANVTMMLLCPYRNHNIATIGRAKELFVTAPVVS